MEFFQWIGIVLFILALISFVLANFLFTFHMRRGLPFLPQFGCLFFAFVGIFMAMSNSIDQSLEIKLVNTIVSKSNSIVFLDGVGLIRGISEDQTANGNDTLYLNFKSTVPWTDLGHDGGIFALAAANGIIYVSQLYDTILLSFDGAIVVDAGLLPGQAPHIAALADAIDGATFNIFTTVGKTVYGQNNMTINGTISPYALCTHHSNLYISDNMRVLIWRHGKIVRKLGPLPAARRMQVWLDKYLVIVPLRLGAQTQIFNLDGKFVRTISGIVTDLAVSSSQLFLTEGTTIRIFEQV